MVNKLIRSFRLSHVTRVSLLLVLAGVISLGWWLARDPVRDLVTTQPGLDNRGEGVVVADIDIGAYGENYSVLETGLTETWPRFRGEFFNNISRSEVPLIEKFPEDGPLVKWTVPLGEGHAGAAIYKGVVYVLDYDEEERADLLRAYSLETGDTLWVRGYKINLKRNHGMSRTVPAVTEDYILTIGPRSHVMCVNRADGSFRWGLNVEKEYGAEIPLWYTGQCPLIHEGKAIIATGGSALLVALDMETGEVLWETPNDRAWLMSHSSVMPYEFGGRSMYVYSAYGGVAGVAADGPDAGTILWETTAWNHQVIAPSPVCMPDGTIFLTAGYGAGAMVLQLRASGGSYSVEVINEYAPKDGLASEQQTPVEFDGHLLGILPKDAGPLRNQLVCVHPGNFNQVVWSSGQDKRFGLGPYMIADNKLFIVDDDATLTIVRPSSREYLELDSYRVLEGHDAWGPLAIADGYLVMRDSKTMVCLDMAVERQ
ncbi:MAG: PQQ-binding-like beta-propeller repeat protein [Bacteroidales bacterium]|nr:PQQ-binding-like beta-propeller repeat protein [Bacteroidales bacterium]